MRRREPSQGQLVSWQQEIERNGAKRISARRLLNAFGYKRRSQKSIENIVHRLESLHPAIFVSDLKYVRLLDEPVYLTPYKPRRIGHFAETEKNLMERFEKELMPKLVLRNARKHYPPKGSRDILDFLCEDEDGRSVVVEIKKKDGEKRVVEQVLRYIRHLRSDPSCNDPRGLIITGYEDSHTRRALEELKPTYEIDWFVYGISDDDEILVERIPVQMVR